MLCFPSPPPSPARAASGDPDYTARLGVERMISSNTSANLACTAASMWMGRPHSREVSPGHFELGAHQLAKKAPQPEHHPLGAAGVGLLGADDRHEVAAALGRQIEVDDFGNCFCKMGTNTSSKATPNMAGSSGGLPPQRQPGAAQYTVAERSHFEPVRHRLQYALRLPFGFKGGTELPQVAILHRHISS